MSIFGIPIDLFSFLVGVGLVAYVPPVGKVLRVPLKWVWNLPVIQRLVTALKERLFRY